MAVNPNQPERWSKVAKVYDDSVRRITTLHATDLLAAILPDVQKATTVLELACGTGAFAEAYVKQFPTGVKGQTVIFSDFSSQMVQTTKNFVTSRVPDDYQTQFEYRIVDARNIESVEDATIDTVVSIFGVFLIHPREVPLAEVRRVLRDDGMFATTSWTSTPCDLELRDSRFGGPFQGAVGKAFMEFVELEPEIVRAFEDWQDPDAIQNVLTAASFKFHAVFRTLHSVVFNSVDELWDVIQSSPMLDFENVSVAKIDGVKKTLAEDLTGPHGLSPIFLLTGANIAIVNK